MSLLEARVVRRVHAELTIEATIRLGAEIGVLFGPSGAGKSTLLRLLAGLDRPDAGRIAVGGEVLFDSLQRINVPLRRRRIGMIFQDHRLFPHLDVAGNIGFGLRTRSQQERRRRLVEIAALCGVSGLLERRVETLSGGERQRVGLARALAPRPLLLLCDEPVSALDLPGRRSLLDRLRQVQQEEGLPILYVTHSPSEAITLGTRLFLMEAGRLVAEGAPAEVLAAAGRSEFLHLEGVPNAFSARVAGHGPDRDWTQVKLDGGPMLTTSFQDLAPGERVAVEIDGDDVMLAVGLISGLSAHNQIEGRVEAVARHGREAEVVVRTGDSRWLVGTLASTPSRLGLVPGETVTMIFKARSVRVDRPLG